MNDYIDKTLLLLKSKKSPTAKWEGLLRICKSSEKSGLWDELPEPGIEKDIAAASKWLALELGKMPKANGVCLGLDTLNMVGRGGFNVGISSCSKGEVSERDLGWVYSCSKRGKPHLIKSMLAFWRVYTSSRWEAVASHADYLLPLAYSGLVLSEAIAALPLSRHLHFAWGFHDGDLLFLGKIVDGSLIRVFSCPET